MEGVTTAGAARSGRLNFVIILATFNLARTRRLIVAASLRSIIVRRRTTYSRAAAARPSDDGRTALHLAAGEGASRVAAKLVELGADVKKADRQGRNALDIARAAGYYDLEARLRLLAET